MFHNNGLSKVDSRQKLPSLFLLLLSLKLRSGREKPKSIIHLLLWDICIMIILHVYSVVYKTLYVLCLLNNRQTMVRADALFPHEISAFPVSFSS